MPRTRRGSSPREQFWQAAVADWRQSGQSVRAFCAGRGLSEPSFYAWRRTLQERARQRPAARRLPVLVPLRVIAAAVLEVALPTGVVVRVPAGADAAAVATVAQLVAVLRTASC